MVKKQAVKTKNPNGRGTREQAGIVIEINKSKVINRKTEWQTKQREQAKVVNQNKGCHSQNLNNPAYWLLGTENDQRSDGGRVYRLRYTLLGKKMGLTQNGKILSF